MGSGTEPQPSQLLRLAQMPITAPTGVTADSRAGKGTTRRQAQASGGNIKSTAGTVVRWARRGSRNRTGVRARGRLRA